MHDTIAETIIEKIRAHASPDAGHVTLDTDLTQLGIHSLELTEIIFDIEDAFGIEIEMSTVDAWSNLASVRDIVEVVRGLIESPRA